MGKKGPQDQEPTREVKKSIIHGKIECLLYSFQQLLFRLFPIIML